MALKKLLKRHQDDIHKKWVDRILQSYPADAARFWKKQSDPFANPVGNTLLGETRSLAEGLIEGKDTESLAHHVEPIIKIRAIHDLTASQAVSFMFLLKEVIRESARSRLRDPGMAEELRMLESNIDALALRAFDVYVRCREQIYELRVNEIKRSISTLLRRVNTDDYDLELRPGRHPKGSQDR